MTQYLGLSLETEDLIDDTQCSTFGLLLNLVNNNSKSLTLEQKNQVCKNAKELISKNIYKCERASFEMALEFIMVLVQDDSDIRFLVFESMLEDLIKLGNYVQSEEIQIKLVQIFTNLLSTCAESDNKILVTSNQTIQVQIVVNQYRK